MCGKAGQNEHSTIANMFLPVPIILEVFFNIARTVAECLNSPVSREIK